MAATQLIAARVTPDTKAHFRALADRQQLTESALLKRRITLTIQSVSGAGVLAGLAALDPGGRLENRPLNSLRSILPSWSPNTNATVRQRLDVLDSVVRLNAEIGWNLVSKLMPRHGDVSSPTTKPRYREAGASDAEDLTWGRVWESQNAIIDRALGLADGNSSRLETIVRAMSNFNEEQVLKSIELLRRFLAGRSSRRSEPVWEALHSEVGRHKSFPDAEWTLKGEMLRLLDEVVTEYGPDDPVGQFAWLFNEWHHSIPGKGREVDTESVEAARHDALKQVFEQLGVDGLKELLKSVKLPQLVAQAMAGVLPVVRDHAEMVRWGVAQGGNIRAFAISQSSVAFDEHKEEWVEQLRSWVVEGSVAPREISDQPTCGDAVKC